MNVNQLFTIITELTISLNFTKEMATLLTMRGTGNDIVWCNGGNCRIITVDQVKELCRTALLFTQLADETEIKKGPPPQHRIYWDDCPKVPSDLSKLLHDKADDQSTDASVND